MQHPLRVFFVVCVVAFSSAGVAQAASPIEGVWSFGGGRISIAPGAGDKLTGTVVSAAKFSNCTHQVGEEVWTEIAERPDGSYWGSHQWFNGSKCRPISTLGPAAWRVLSNAAGSTYIAFCTSEPGGSQPTISVTGATAGATQCIDSGAIPDTAIVSGPSGLSASASASFDFTSTESGSFECRLDGTDWTDCSAPQSYGSLADGPHSFEVRAATALGDVDPTPAASNFSIDTTAPETTIVSGPSGPIAADSATFALDSTEPGTFECRLDSGAEADWAPCETPSTYGSLSQGEHTFEVRSSDALGNTDATPASADFSVDTTAPVATIASGPTGPIATESATFTFDSSEPGSFECRLDSTSEADWEPCDSPITYESLSQGPHSFEVRSVDVLGNTDTDPASTDFSVDTVAPETTVTSGPEGPIAAAASSFAFASSKAGTFECRLDSDSEDDWDPCDSPQAYTSLKDGPHAFEVRAVDDLLNTDPTPAIADFSVDTRAPETTIISAPEGPISSVQAVATFAMAASEPGTFECRLDPSAEAGWGPCAASVSYGSLAEGSHAFEARAVDALGNTDQTPAAASFTVDTPVNGAKLAVAPISGRVRIQTPESAKFRPLVEGETIPVGSIVDTTEGKARLFSVDESGEEQSAAFFEGIFRVGQRVGRGLVTLKLRGGDFSDCGAARASASARRGGRQLWGSGHGNFRTEGSNGSATVRGTIWFTEDRCDGTFFKVRRGVVAVRDYLLGKTISVPAGKSYLAQSGD